jgi:hypothetical protein
MNLHKWLLIPLCAALLACGSNDTVFLPAQHWKNVEIVVEARPSPLRVGANEFIVRATNKDGRAAYDLVMSIRLNDSRPWQQAIQDGQTGIYRRGLILAAGEHVDSLSMRIVRGDEQGFIKFPLQVEESSTPGPNS